MSRLLLRINHFIQRFEQAIFGRGFPHDSLCLAGCPGYTPAAFEQVAPPTKSSFSIKELIGDGILWAVPHHRRSIERRLKRKFAPNFPSIVHRNNRLTICSHCGNHKEIGLLCPTCYAKVTKETQEMRLKIEEELGLDPVDKSVIVLYDGERQEQPSEFWEGKRVVEMNKPRPTWFAKNLMQRSTEPPAATKEIKPSDLG